MTPVPLTPAQQHALIQLLRGGAVRVKELLELEALGLAARRVPQPSTIADFEVTEAGRHQAEEISQ